MNEFLNNPVIQYLTVLLSFIPLLVAFRTWRRHEVSQQLSGESLRTFRKLCSDTIAQYMVAMGAPILFAVAQTWAGNQNLASNLTNAYLTAVALAGIASLWNVFKAHRDGKTASQQPGNKARAARLRDVNEKNLSSYFAALFSLVIGSIGLIAYNLLPSPPPWPWFAAFLLSAIAVHGLVWSHNVAAVAAAYESKPGLGRAMRRR